MMSSTDADRKRGSKHPVLTAWLALAGLLARSSVRPTLALVGVLAAMVAATNAPAVLFVVLIPVAVMFRALISALHRAMQKLLPVTLAAAGLPQIPRLAGEARSYAERLFRFPHIGALDELAARAALVLPAEREGATYDEKAVERTLELTQGYPFYLQEYGKHIWNLAPGSPITERDVEAAAPRAEESLGRGIYEVRSSERRSRNAGTCGRWPNSEWGLTRSGPWPKQWAAPPQGYPQCDRNSLIEALSTPPRTTATSTSQSRASMSSCVATRRSGQRPPDPPSHAVGAVRNHAFGSNRKGPSAQARAVDTWHCCSTCPCWFSGGSAQPSSFSRPEARTGDGG